ncbi:MAG: putative 2OG-Fe(II) oxygenase, partial [Pseudomonadota bacterium]
VLKRDPYDQLALAYLGTAWRLQDDPREAWLMDFDQMVRPVAVDAPPEFSSRDQFFQELKICLEELHRSKAHPLEQTLRNGTQTNGYLFRLKHPLLRSLEQQIRLAVSSALADFPVDPEHPFWGRRSVSPRGDGMSFSGAWSVRLHSEGFHANHIHPEGWISSALYIALPDEMERSGEHAGSIQFGVPLDIALPPKRIIRPSVGTLVLFPSYMWHGTVPFTDPQPRITVAFDLVPEQ